MTRSEPSVSTSPKFLTTSFALDSVSTRSHSTSDTTNHSRNAKTRNSPTSTVSLCFIVMLERSTTSSHQILNLISPLNQHLPTKPMSKTKVRVRAGAEGGKVTEVAEGQSPLDWTLSHCVPTSPTAALATLIQQGSATSSDTNQSRPTQTRPLYQGLVSQRRRQPPQPLQLLLLYSPAHVSHGPKTHHATVATAASTNTRHTCLLTTPLHTSLWGTSSSSTSISETAYAPTPTLASVSPVS